MTVLFSRQVDKSGNVTRNESEGASNASGLNEHRVHQSFVAKLHGEPCFWALIGEEHLALNNLSLTGFALPAPPMFIPGEQFYFILQREGMSDTVRGRAVVNDISDDDNPSAGCRIIQFEDSSEKLLHDWLVMHVIRCSAVRISEKNANDIVSGRSLV